MTKGMPKDNPQKTGSVWAQGLFIHLTALGGKLPRQASFTKYNFLIWGRVSQDTREDLKQIIREDQTAARTALQAAMDSYDMAAALLAVSTQNTEGEYGDTSHSRSSSPKEQGRTP